MKIIVDIGHPAHVHLFKHFITEMKSRGHELIVTSRDKDVSIGLLNLYNISFINLGKPGSGTWGKFIKMFYLTYKFLFLLGKYKPQIAISTASPSLAQSSFILGIPHLIFGDTETARWIYRFSVPFSKALFTPDCFEDDYGKKHFRYPGYHELAYLHPNYFQPNESIKKQLITQDEDRYVIIRFVSWSASHDNGRMGISEENKLLAVQELSKHAKVIISSESNDLPSALVKYKIELTPDKMHDALSYASMIFGESATMASEAAVLGIPAIFIDNDGRGYTNEEMNKYGIVFYFKESEQGQREAISKGVEILKNSEKQKWLNARQNILSDKIDVTKFIVRIVEEYPESINRKKNIPFTTNV